MSHLDGFDFGDLQIEEIPIDEEEEARDYAVRIYERIKRLERPDVDALQREIIETTSKSSTSSSIIYSDESTEEKMPDGPLVKKMVSVGMDDMEYHAPIFYKVDDLREWTKVLSQHEKRFNETIDKLNVLGQAQKIKDRS